jgi:hypothetical protein
MDLYISFRASLQQNIKVFAMACFNSGKQQQQQQQQQQHAGGGGGGETAVASICKPFRVPSHSGERDHVAHYLRQEGGGRALIERKMDEETGLTNIFIANFMREKSNCRNFEGVFSADTIPEERLLKLARFSIIANLSKAKEKGTHFVCVMKLSEDSCLYLDPLALNFTLHSHIKKFIGRLQCGQPLILAKPVQAVMSTKCGWFTIYFCMLFDSAFNLNAALVKFSSKTLLKNDHVCLKNIQALLRRKNG